MKYRISGNSHFVFCPRILPSSCVLHYFRDLKKNEIQARCIIYLSCKIVVILRDFLFQNFNTLRTLRKRESHGKNIMYVSVNERLFSFFKSNLNCMDLRTFGCFTKYNLFPYFFHTFDCNKYK